VWLLMVAALCAGLFAGAAIYINAVEHPARLACGTELAIREFAPSYHRATVVQASLAVMGCAMGLWSAWLLADVWIAMGAISLGSVVPFTLVVILPTNRQLLDSALDPRSKKAADLLARWGRLHMTRSTLSSVAFVLFLVRLAIS
jgi:anthrone oxygenase-like protein